MPFPAQFCELTSGEMKRQTYLVLENLCRKYGAAELAPLDDSAEEAARQVMLTRLHIL